MTGTEPRTSSQVNALRGPIRSHSHPIRIRTRMVMATAAMAELPTCSLVRWSSSRIIGIRGAIPNQPKKHRKNASHAMWKARIGALWKSSSLIVVALFRMFIWPSLLKHAQNGAPERASYGEGLFVAQKNDLLRVIDMYWVSLQSAIAKQRLAGGQIELPGMQRTNQRGSANQTIRQRPTLVRTRRLHGVNLTTAGMENSNVLPFEGVNAPFAGRNTADWSQFRFRHDSNHARMGSTEAN